jgi:hypothetical protein
MKYLHLLLSLALFASLTSQASASDEVYFRASPGKKVSIGGGGNGTSYRKAILVHTPAGANPVGREYEYVMSRFPTCKVTKYQREFYTSRTYDILTFVAPDGATRALFFQVAWEH